jgi:molybdopterin biosynthesis enzyme
MHHTGKGAADDVRMRGFARRHTVDAALAWLDAHLQPLALEVIPLRNAAGRVLTDSVVSDVDVPGFDRATMDGYAVVADSTAGATAYTRLQLAVVGDSMPGCPLTAVSPQAKRFVS